MAIGCSGATSCSSFRELDERHTLARAWREPHGLTEHLSRRERRRIECRDEKQVFAPLAGATLFVGDPGQQHVAAQLRMTLWQGDDRDSEVVGAKPGLVRLGMSRQGDD